MKRHDRQYTRLPDYDYSKDGAYFVTVCTKNRVQSLARIENGKAILSKVGLIVHALWPAVIGEIEGIEMDEFVIMPNHMHGIIHVRRGLINQTPTTANSRSSWILMQNPSLTLGKIVRYSKAKATRIIRKNGFEDFAWQRNYHDRIIRNEEELNATRQYILNNPMKWEFDRENSLSVNYDVDHDIYFKNILCR